MKGNNSFGEIWDKIKGSSNVLMTLHSAPDGDSIGSCLSMKYVLDIMRIKCKIVGYDPVPENLEDFEFLDEIELGTDISDVDFNEFDLILFFDCGAMSYISGKLRKELKIPKNVFKINIDHHLSNTYHGDMNYVDSSKASCCSVLIDFFKFKGINFNKDLCTRLLLGVSTDTLYFTTEDSPSAIIEAGFLIEKGGDYLEVLKKSYFNEPLKMHKYYSLLFDKLVIDKRGFGYSLITNSEVNKLGLNESEARLGISKMQFTKELKFVFNLIEFPDHIKGSFRSKKGIDVSKFAVELGGGGHKFASAFRLSKMTLNDARDKVISAIDKVIENQEIH
ncbi:hypothetical protein GOV12_02520 [Candidatus Pacearchaeota archaeon]|nr:hypothetical protein [Candidatus Pacearchaeota archaeon]